MREASGPFTRGRMDGQDGAAPRVPAPPPRTGFLKGCRHVAAVRPRTEAAATSRRFTYGAGGVDRGGCLLLLLAVAGVGEFALRAR